MAKTNLDPYLMFLKLFIPLSICMYLLHGPGKNITPLKQIKANDSTV